MANETAARRPRRRAVVVGLVAFVLFSTVLADTLPGRAVLFGWRGLGTASGQGFVAEDGEPSLYRPGKHIDLFYGSAPFDAGAGCTGAFVVQRFGQDYGLTAKHCGEVGSEVWLGRYGGEAVRLGKVEYAAEGTDASMFPVGTTEGDVWADDVPLRVSGMIPARDLAVGVKLFQHGSTTGREVLGSVSSRTADGRYCIHLGSDEVHHGDSGGPVYTYAADGSALAVGIVSGGGTNPADGQFVTCFVPIDRALRELSARLKVRDPEGKARYVAPV